VFFVVYVGEDADEEESEGEGYSADWLDYVPVFILLLFE
jgi:hypothetical protein